MINFLLGAPGGGKSYEAVVFHILPALLKGRKVITNLPVNVEQFEKIVPGASELLEIRTKTLFPRPEVEGPRPWKPLPFWHPDDFADRWRHPEKGFGALYVVDECHLVLPKIGTLVSVEEWFSLHRHHNADVLLITQSYGKVSPAIRDLCQVVYRVRKNVALGSMGSYTRKVQDGLRGEVVNTTVRKYEPKYFPLYKSHTQSTTGAELSANDIRPIWKHWSFIGSAVLLVVFFSLLSSGAVKNPLAVQTSAPKAPAKPQASPQAAQSPPQAQPSAVTPALHTPGPEKRPPEPPAVIKVDRPDPYQDKGLHLLGSATFGGVTRWMFLLSQNGTVVSRLDDRDLAQAGFSWVSGGHCVGWLRYTHDPDRPPRAVSCDSPQTSMVNAPST